MGLTIHYTLKSKGTEATARKLVTALHARAQTLGFKVLGDVVELEGEQCDFNKRKADDDLQWLLIQARESLEITGSPRGQHSWVDVIPTRLIAFNTWPGEGCESANFGLCRYPARIETSRGSKATKLSGWHWHSFCKTQYASEPGCGGTANFVRCHLLVTAMLAQAKQLGFLADVSDGGGFWDHRDVAALVKEVGTWNESMAAFAGLLTDRLGAGPVGVASAISSYSNFEHLEAAGQKHLPAPEQMEQLLRALKELGQPKTDENKTRRCAARTNQQHESCNDINRPGQSPGLSLGRPRVSAEQ